tara:strand:- start:66 stop:401 length:336 start_codon:yes stop_codon:yes gene_type:complete
MTSVNNSMIVVKVIRPYKIKGEAICEKCSLAYSKKHYDTLYKHDKLVYLDITIKDKTRLICHDCFYKFLKKKSRQTKREVTIRVIDGNKRFNMIVTPYADEADADDNTFLL